MSAEILAIGSELTTGAKLDTNSQWLSLELAEIGIPVKYHCTMSDELAAMVEVLRTAVSRSDLVLITGGLGPTLDDLTRHALAELTGVHLALHEPSFEAIKSMFARRNRPMSERNIIQAMFPENSEPIPNPRGTAPGIWMEVPREGKSPCRIAAMPGVPSEMKRMYLHEVLPRLKSDGNGVIRRARINCFGIGESNTEDLLGELTARGSDPDIGITAHEATITLRITAAGKTEEEAQQKIQWAREQIYQRLGDLIFGEEDEELEDAVIKLLREQGLTLSSAESGTGGLLAHRFTSTNGFEAGYLGGVIVPTLESKAQVLGLTADVLKPEDPISREIAEAMAVACRKLFQSDLALAITQTPPYNPEDPNAPVPELYLALATPDKVLTFEHTPLGDTSFQRSRTAKTASNVARRYLLSSASSAK